MANYQQLKAAIDQVIKANGQKEITGPVLNDTLKAMVNSLGAGYQFRGVATPSTNPGTTDQNVFYIAGQAGTYTNFNSIVLPDGVSILKWNGSWSSETVVAGDGVFDISAYKATGGTLSTFADLSAALDGGNNIPQPFRKGGMSVKFVCSSDNKYIQYRNMSQNWSTTVSDWQGVDATPIDGSKNLVESGGVYNVLNITNLSNSNIGCYAHGGTTYDGEWSTQLIHFDGTVVEHSLNNLYLSDYISNTLNLDKENVILRNLCMPNSGNTICNVALYDDENNFVCGYNLGKNCLISIPKGYKIRALINTEYENLQESILINVTPVEIPDLNNYSNLENAVGVFNQVIPFFDNTVNLNYISKIENYFISSSGAKTYYSDGGISYMIFNISDASISDISIIINELDIEGVCAWATYSSLVDNDISDTTVIRKYIAIPDDRHKPYLINLTKQSNENYLAICNADAAMALGYEVKYKIGYINSPSLKNIEKRLEDLENEDVDVDCNIVVMGDSITWQGGDNCDRSVGWTKWFKDKLKPKSIKSFAWSGACWTNSPNTVADDTPAGLTSDDNNVIWNQVRRLINAVNAQTQVTPDVIIIAAGLNDVGAVAQSLRPSTIFDTTAAQTFADQSSYIINRQVNTVLTMAESIRYSCELLIDAFPDVQIILLSQLQNANAMITQPNFDKARTIIKDCASYLSCAYIDQANVCGVYKTQEVLSHWNLADGTHPTERGAKKIGRILAGIIKSLI